MLDLTAESAAQGGSNSFAVFCLCNLLIVIILMSSKPSSNFEERSEFHLALVTHDSVMDEHRIDIERPHGDEETLPEVMELCVYENLEKEGGNYNSEGEDNNEDGGESNSDDDDEFKRRIEAFIDKVTSEWKAEKSRTQCLCEQVDTCEPLLY
ncbi:hypothetical protein EUGRSUZ_K03333 [Eucalyptus grandis]|uniref:Uncharacterized protein n=2 Tax=Eucalyptus grandis TaxID=71139 RepID=A0ACC3IZU6_EUCGR|nr:hypothetical protein EUGRSUZ_K03333 [Eucalyptus grandis]